MKLVRLKFKASLHVGSDNGGIGRENVQEMVHSDTLFSMLVNSVAEIDQGNKKKIEEFIQSVTCLSSGFPFERERSGHRYYLPRPLMDPPDFFGERGAERRLEYGKSLKKCTYVSLEDFSAWISGQEIGVSQLDECMDPPYRKLYAVRTTPQHARDRLTDASQLYHCGELFFKGNAGLCFLVDGVEDALLDSVLKNASLKGLGGRRSLGKGVFEYDIASPGNEWDAVLNGDGTHFVIISLYSPGQDEMAGLSPVSYSLALRKGWTFSSMSTGQFKRKTCRMFGEGSVFSGKPEGHLVDVTPEPVNPHPHPIYRFGTAFAVPCNLMEERHA